MANAYITQADPYMSQYDLSGYAPILADDSRQRATQAAALAQQLQEVNQAGQQQGSGMTGLNPLALALMLRKKKPNDGYGAGDAYSKMTPEEIENMKEHGV